MNRKLLALPLEQIALIFVMVVAALAIAGLGEGTSQGQLVKYTSHYKTNSTACDLAGIPDGMSVTKHSTFELLQRDHIQCYHIAGEEDWYCCTPPKDHWSSRATNRSRYQTNFNRG